MKQLRIQCFQHVDFEDLGCIYNWIKKNGNIITFTRFFENYTIPKPEDFDWLIIMGGPMSVYDDDKYSWLAEEKNVIKQAIENNKTVIGICLGSQLIADVLGAEIYINPEKEIGWFDITLTDYEKNNKLFNSDLDTFKVFHWHEDTFKLPVDAKHLAYSKVCKNQAFLYKKNVLGLQFHFEVTKLSIKAMLEYGSNELIEGNFIQSESQILRQQKYIQFNNDIMFNILDKLNNNWAQK
jgi:GMP synthase-like glutamine amidotransferase